jgi:drug/metabolite transporter (DMT)-like permease
MNLFLLLVLGALWGSSYLFIKVAVAEIPPLTMVAARLVIGAAILWGLLRLMRKPLPRDRATWARYAVMGLLNGALPYSLIFWSEQTISSGLAALLQATMPLFTVLLAHFLARQEKLTLRKVLGVVVGFVGVGLLMLPDLQSGQQAHVLGQAAMVASSLSYAGATLFARSQLRGHAPLASTTGQLTMGALLITPLSLVVEHPLGLSPAPVAIGSLLALTILGTVIAYIIYYALLERTDATFVSTVTYIIPIFGLILGAVVLGEPLTTNLVVSLGLILIGVLLVRK